MKVRELTRDDNLDVVLALCRGFFAEYERHHREFFDTDDLTDDHIAGRFRQSLEDDDSATIVATVDSAIVGYASAVVREQPPFYRIKRIGAISTLMVAPEYRRRGVGTALLDGARSFFKRRGVKYYTFYTAAGNEAAIRLYEKLGFEPLHRSFLGEV